MSDSGNAGPSESLLAMPPSEPNADFPQRPGARILQLDGLRALAIGGVLLNHTAGVPLLWSGVDVFFVLSGFLITGILLERKRFGGPYFAYFYRRRLFRILPPLLLTVVIYGLLFTWTQYRPVWLFLFAPNLHGLLFRPPSIPLWSLAVEEQFYLVWPFVVLYATETVLMGLAVAALVATPILRALCTPLFPSHFYIYSLTPFRADLLCSGAILALLWKRQSAAITGHIRQWAPAVCLLGFGLLAGTQAFPAFRLVRNTPLANSLVYVFSLVGATGLLAWALTDQAWLRALLRSRPLRYLGEISYTVYLAHPWIVMWFTTRLGNSAAVKAFAVLVTLVYASVSWFAMERPLLRFAARRPRSLVRASGQSQTLPGQV